jgi:hypothetical protein
MNLKQINEKHGVIQWEAQVVRDMLFKGLSNESILKKKPHIPIDYLNELKNYYEIDAIPYRHYYSFGKYWTSEDEMIVQPYKASELWGAELEILNSLI